MISDLEARAAALDQQRSFIVQAPAGSGKTGLLVYRLLRLLSVAEQPQEVLAITFTRKATSEMKERVLSLLTDAHAGKTHQDEFTQTGIELAKRVLAQDAKKNWQLLDTPQQLQILTIDSFCAKLAGRMPWLSRLGDRPHTTDNAEAHYQIAVERLLSEMLGQDHQLIAHLKIVLLALDFNYDRVRGLLGSMLAKRDQWLRHLLSINLSEQRGTIEAAWQAIVDTHLLQLRELFEPDALDNLISFAHQASSQLDQDSPLAIFMAPVEPHQLGIEHWRAIRFLMLTADGKKLRSSVNKNQGFPAENKAIKSDFLAFLSTYLEDQTLISLLNQVNVLPAGSFSDQDWQQLLSIEQVLKSLAARLQLRFRSVGECDHSEVARRANLALMELDNPTDLGLRLDCQIQHILVDEFQDTSHSQVQLLKRLTLGWSLHDTSAKTLFLVGDPMQSIYRFREADVSLFLQVANNSHTAVFDNIDIELLVLSENFRSSQSMVNWFNHVFSDTFPQHNNDVTGAVSYSRASGSKASGQGQAVQCLLATDNEAQANLIVDCINQAIAELPKADDQVAILVRNRGQLSSLLPALQMAGIDYTGVDIKPLASLQAVLDVLALTKALCRLDDRVSWLSLLRGPWCGLSLAEIKVLTQNQQQTVWTSICNARLDAFTQDTQRRLTRMAQVLEISLGQKQQVSLVSLLRWTWQQLGGPDCLMDASMDDIDVVFDLIAQHEVGGDIASINQLDAALDGLYAQATTSQNGQSPRVLVSTMHKAKGLQYHTVILPSLSSPSRSDDKEILMWSELPGLHGDTRLLLAPMHLKPKLDQGQGLHYAYLRELEKRRASHEAERLIYVACTRAERKLILVATANRSEDKDGVQTIRQPNCNSLLAKVWPSLETEFDFPVLSAQQSDTTAQRARVYPQTLFRLPSDYTPKLVESVQWQSVQQANASQAELIDTHAQEVEYDWAQPVAIAVGTVLHRWLQYNSDTVLNARIDDAQLMQWRAELIAQRVPNKHIKYGLERLTRGVRNIQMDKKIHFLFADYELAFNEYAIAYNEDGIVKRRWLDRTFIDNDGVRWVVDYKTTDTQQDDLAAFADQQVERHRAQLDEYGRLMSELDDAPIQLAVYFPLLNQLRTWRYQTSV